MNRSADNHEKLDRARLRIADVRGRYRYVRWRWRLMFALLDTLGWLLFWPAHAWRLLTQAPSHPKRMRTILVIQLDHLGDAVLSTGLLYWLKHRFPAASLEVLTSAWNAALFQELTNVDQVHVLRQTRFARQRGGRWILALLRQAWELRRRRYDLAIDVRGEAPHAAAMWLCGARHRIGWAAGGGGFLLTKSIPFVPRRHEVASRAAIASVIAGKAIAADDVAPHTIADEIRIAKDAQHPITRHERQQEQAAIALHIGAGTAAKTWPAAHWRGLIRDLLQWYPHKQILLLGGPAEVALANQICASQNERTRQGRARGRDSSVINLCGQLSLAALTKVVANCAVLVGADSGPAHLAAACGTPVVALFSGTNHPEQWRPWGDHVAVLKHEVDCSPCHREVCPLAQHPCLREIRPTQVLQAVVTQLDDRTAPRERRQLGASKPVFVAQEIMPEREAPTP